MRRTKIVCTIGPATSAEEMLAGLIREGMNVARLNFSHGTQADHARVITRLRAIARAAGEHIGILQDLQGPKIRTGRLQGGGPVELREGEPLIITTRDEEGYAGRISTTYEALPHDVHAGDRLLLADGRMELSVESAQDAEVHCRVVRGGSLGEHKGINLPGVSISAPSLTEKDVVDLRFGLAQGVDYVAISFVRSAADVQAARRVMEAVGRTVPIIAKLEKPEAIARLDEILDVSDGVMVARGDLGVEMPLERVPLLQKDIIARANRRRIPVITATEMLESMITGFRPTRAEASDVANAVLDGSDAVMLSGETAVGAYPLEAVNMMHRIAVEAEGSELGVRAAGLSLDGPAAFPHAIAHAAYQAAVDTHARAVIAFTQSGYTPLLVSKYRPRLPILAVTPSEEVARRVQLYWGVVPQVVEAAGTSDEIVSRVEAAAARSALLQPGDITVIVARAAANSWGTTNFLKIHRVGMPG